MPEHKDKIQKRLDKLPDDCASELLQFIQFLEYKVHNGKADRSSVLLSESSLAKEWLTPEEDEVWEHL